MEINVFLFKTMFIVVPKGPGIFMWDVAQAAIEVLQLAAAASVAVKNHSSVQ